jgi:hypothetical protein
MKPEFRSVCTALAPPISARAFAWHFHYGLFADILHDLAKTVSSVPPADAAHRDALREGAKALYQALNPRRNDKDDIAQMTPEEEVLLSIPRNGEYCRLAPVRSCNQLLRSHLAPAADRSLPLSPRTPGQRV